MGYFKLSRITHIRAQDLPVPYNAIYSTRCAHWWCQMQLQLGYCEHNAFQQYPQLPLKIYQNTCNIKESLRKYAVLAQLKSCSPQLGSIHSATRGHPWIAQIINSGTLQIDRLNILTMPMQLLQCTAPQNFNHIFRFVSMKFDNLAF